MIGDFVIFIFEFTGTGIFVTAGPDVVDVDDVDVDAVVVAVVSSDVDGVVDIDVFLGNIVAGDMLLVDVFGVGFVGAVEVVVNDGFDEDATVIGSEECSNIIDDAVERFVDDAEVIVNDDVGFILVDSTKVVVDDFDVVVGDDFDEILAVASIG